MVRVVMVSDLLLALCNVTTMWTDDPLFVSWGEKLMVTPFISSMAEADGMVIMTVTSSMNDRTIAAIFTLQAPLYRTNKLTMIFLILYQTPILTDIIIFEHGEYFIMAENDDS
jgi:hypothetical protein